MTTAFQADAFQTTVLAFQIDGVAAVPTVGPLIIGGGYLRSRTRKEVSRDRERFGIPDEERIAAERVIAEIAARQAKRLEQDEHKRFEELSRELELRGLVWDARYLESLNIERERLIDAELARIITEQREALRERNKAILVDLFLATARREENEQEELFAAVRGIAVNVAPALAGLCPLLLEMHETFEKRMEADMAPKPAPVDPMMASKERFVAEMDKLSADLFEATMKATKTLVEKHLEVTLH